MYNDQHHLVVYGRWESIPAQAETEVDAGSAIEKRGLPGVDRPQEEAGVSAEAKVDDVSGWMRDTSSGEPFI